MKIKINQKLNDVTGKPIMKPEGEELTLKDVIISSVLTPTQEDDEKKKWEKYEIYKKVRDANDEVEFTVEQVAVIKKCIGKLQPQLIMGQCFEMIESQ